MDTMRYRISSRAAILLGRESVSKAEGAIAELVKNCYDADADFCYLCFDAAGNRLIIIDNGTGMTKEVIDSNWMTIGTDNKQKEFKSRKGRIKSGEKGIGRFALDRLGKICSMYTKSKSDELIYWETDWQNFEIANQLLEDVSAKFTYANGRLIKYIPTAVLNNLKKFEKDKKASFSLDTGTILIISDLRDSWSKRDVSNIVESLGFLIPPEEQSRFTIFVQEGLESEGREVVNDLNDDYDYKLEAKFDGVDFEVRITRNELELNKVPQELFDHNRFSTFPYRKEDFDRGSFTCSYTISQLMRSDSPEYLDLVKRIGGFSFVFTFMKLSTREDGRGINYYRSPGAHRRKWLAEYSGIRIYRDHSVVRPYGDKSSNSYDWLNLDKRKGVNPVAVSDKSGSWHVSNSQSQGTVSISRITNESILDTINREGIIENDVFAALGDVLLALIGLFESDRAYIARTIRLFTEEKDEKEEVKKTGREIARVILEDEKKRNHPENDEARADDAVKLAKTVEYLDEEMEELVSEIRLLRALATNGLITTSMVHDLKSLEGLLVSRVDGFKQALERKNIELVNRNLKDLRTNDIFLKAWIKVISQQSSQDKRTRKKKDLYKVIANAVDLLDPILKRKRVKISLEGSGEFNRRLFEIDFDSIVYNLIVNSIESFERSTCEERLIIMKMENTDKEFILHYTDNGDGLSEAFKKEPYKIFEYGKTSKVDKQGNQYGTGLGMYIVASSIEEYHGSYSLRDIEKSFSVDIAIPKG